MKRHLLIVSLFLLDCGRPPRPPPVNPTAEPPTATPAPPIKEAPVDVKMRVLAMTSVTPDPHEIVNGETLRSGDKVALTVKVVDQPAYVYVAKASSDGTATRIYPDSGDVQVSPDNLIHIPREGHWFKLDQHTGQENFFVYAAKQSIPADVLDARMKSDAAAIKKPARVKPATSPRPTNAVSKPNSTDRDAPAAISRGLLEIENDDSAGPSGPNGIIRRRFTIQHGS